MPYKYKGDEKRYNHRYYIKNKEKFKEYHRKWYENNDGIKRKYFLGRKYGITLLQYNEMVKKQNSVCAICGKRENKGKNGKERDLSVDHDHKTGVIRGLLCQDCNRGIGCFRDSVDLLQKTIKYLRNS